MLLQAMMGLGIFVAMLFLFSVCILFPALYFIFLFFLKKSSPPNKTLLHGKSVFYSFLITFVFVLSVLLLLLNGLSSTIN